MLEAHIRALEQSTMIALTLFASQSGVAPEGAGSPTPGLRRPRLAGPRPRLLLSPSRSRSERRRRHASSRGAPLGTVRPRTVTRTKACDPSATASALPLGWPPPAETPPGYSTATTRLTPRARLDATAHRRQDTDAPGRLPARAGFHRLAEPWHWPPPEALQPWALRADPTRLPHTICSGTTRDCENGGPPPLPK